MNCHKRWYIVSKELILKRLFYAINFFFFVATIKFVTKKLNQVLSNACQKQKKKLVIKYKFIYDKIFNYYFLFLSLSEMIYDKKILS